MGLAWFAYVADVRIINPVNIDWVLQGEYGMGFLTASWGRSAPWSIPLGQQTGFAYPVGVTLALADGIPWAGVLLKVLSPWLPQAFQYHGLWLALCFFLQGFFGVRLVEQLAADRVASTVGGALFALSPVLAYRFGHLALCGHWLVVAALWLSLRAYLDARSARRGVVWSALLCVIAAGVHPYLATMVLVLCLALVMRLWRYERLQTALGAGASAGLFVSVTGLTWALLGYLQGGPKTAEGFTWYSANLNSLFNPGGLSRILPGLPASPGQYEGYGYLGLGALVLLAWAAVLLYRGREELRRSGWRRFMPLGIAVTAMAVFSLSSRVLLGTWTLVSYQKLFLDLFAPLAETFRSPGRFIWPLHYALLAGAMAVVCRFHRSRPSLLAGGLLGALVLQGVDFRAENTRTHFEPQYRALTSPAWSVAAGEYMHLVLYPPFLADGAGNGCENTAFTEQDVVRFGFEAYLRGWTLNSGFAARLDAERVRAACADRGIEHGEVAEDTIYVLHSSRVAIVLERSAGELHCGRLDGEAVCVSSRRPSALREALTRSPLLALASCGGCEAFRAHRGDTWVSFKNIKTEIERPRFLDATFPNPGGKTEVRRYYQGPLSLRTCGEQAAPPQAAGEEVSLCLNLEIDPASLDTASAGTSFRIDAVGEFRPVIDITTLIFTPGTQHSAAIPRAWAEIECSSGLRASSVTQAIQGQVTLSRVAKDSLAGRVQLTVNGELGERDCGTATGPAEFNFTFDVRG
jgi:hypothetical protein